ncbi:MAG: two-component system regulatory protein YycI [Limosilactobacillus sp.]|uniref:two-component system regulatory protein YycI n=1 Tax=Limosilactobacillus sp. TaxID=2773925 RepID=UPI0026F4AB2D|nr:two-component system regulatory protein YycI [Limosilactobacillus sp.]
MNFKRIQWIFFVAFVIFDVIVASQLLFQNRFTISNGAQNKQAVLKEMTADSISYGKLSNTKPNAFYISGARSGENGVLAQKAESLKGQTTRFNNNIMISSFEKPIKINAKHPNYRIDKLIKKSGNVPLGKYYKYNQQLSDKHQVVYTQMVKGHPILSADGQIKFHINANNELTGYNQGYLEKTRILQQRMTAISKQRAVVWLYRHNQIPNNSQIRWAILGYTRLLTTNDNDQAVYAPTWMVNVRTKTTGAVQRLNVNAFNSTVIKTNSTTINVDSIK